MTIKKNLFAVTLVTVMTLILSSDVLAQTEVTFRVNLRQLMRDSTFVPGRDLVRVKGDLRPFSRVNTFVMEQDEKNDSVYTVTINFPRRYNGEELTYNYFLQIAYRGNVEEDLPRYLKLTGRKTEIVPLEFNSYPF